MVLIALIIKIDSPGPVLFRQKRVGRFGKRFRIHKFRTMKIGAETAGPLITVGRDARVTRVGSFLRRSKLDEIPQLIDVFWGNMSLVGPRPEVPQYMACYPEHARTLILSVKPGITDWASIEYRNESEILGAANDPQQTYVNEIMPIKISYYLKYVECQSFWGDLQILVATIKMLTRGQSSHK